MRILFLFCLLVLFSATECQSTTLNCYYLAADCCNVEAVAYMNENHKNWNRNWFWFGSSSDYDDELRDQGLCLSTSTTSVDSTSESITTPSTTTTESTTTVPTTTTTTSLNCGALNGTACCTKEITECLTVKYDAKWTLFNSTDGYEPELAACGCVLTSSTSTASSTTTTMPPSTCSWLSDPFDYNTTMYPSTTFIYNGTCCTDIALQTLNATEPWLTFETVDKFNKWKYLVNLLFCTEGACSDPSPPWTNCSLTTTSSTSTTSETTSSASTTVVPTNSTVSTSTATSTGLTTPEEDKTSTMSTSTDSITTINSTTTSSSTTNLTDTPSTTIAASTGTGATESTTPTKTSEGITTPPDDSSSSSETTNTTTSTSSTSTTTGNTTTRSTSEATEETTALNSTTSGSTATGSTATDATSSGTTTSESTASESTSSSTTATGSTASDATSSRSTVSGSTVTGSASSNSSDSTTMGSTSTGWTWSTSSESTVTGSTSSNSTTSGWTGSTSPSSTVAGSTSSDSTTSGSTASGLTSSVSSSTGSMTPTPTTAGISDNTTTSGSTASGSTASASTVSESTSSGSTSGSTTSSSTTTPSTTSEADSTRGTTTRGTTTNIDGVYFRNTTVQVFPNCTERTQELVFFINGTTIRNVTVNLSACSSTSPLTTPESTTTYNWPTGGTTRVLPSGEIILSESLIAYKNCTTVLMQLIYNPSTNKTRTETTTDAEGCKKTSSTPLPASTSPMTTPTPSATAETTTFNWPTGGTTRTLPNGEIILSESLIAYKNCTTVLMQLIYNPSTNKTRTETTTDAEGCKASSSISSTTPIPSTPSTTVATTTFNWPTGGTTRVLPSGEIILSESLIAYKNCTTVLMQLIYNPSTNKTRTETTTDAQGCKASSSSSSLATTPMPSAKTTTYNWPTGGTTRVLPSGEIILSESLIAYKNCTTVLMQLIYNPSTNKTRTETTTDAQGCKATSSSSHTTTPMSGGSITPSPSAATTTFNWPTGGTTRTLPNGEIILSESLIAYKNCTTVLMQLIYNPSTNKTRTETTTDAQGCKATSTGSPASGTSPMTTTTTTTTEAPFTFPESKTTQILPNGEIILSETLTAYPNCTTVLRQLIYNPSTNKTRTETTTDAQGCKATTSTTQSFSSTSSPPPANCSYPNLDLTSTTRPSTSDIKTTYAVGERIVHMCKKYYAFETARQPLKIYQCMSGGRWAGTPEKCVAEQRTEL